MGTYPGNVISGVAFREDNTAGYSYEELASLNEELARKLEGLEPSTDLYYETAKRFHDEVARRS